MAKILLSEVIKVVRKTQFKLEKLIIVHKEQNTIIQPHRSDRLHLINPAFLHVCSLQSHSKPLYRFSASNAYVISMCKLIVNGQLPIHSRKIGFGTCDV